MTSRHVCSLDLSRRLADAGFPQECVFAWYAHEQPHVCEPKVMTADHGPCFKFWDRSCAAPLLSEIMEQMPEVRCGVSNNGNTCFAYESFGDKRCSGHTLPDAAAALWLALRGV